MIAAVFYESDTARSSGLWQWDYGQVLRIQGLSLPPAVEIHFSTQETGGDSKPRIGVTHDGVTDVPIPDSVLENGGATQDYYIYAWVYLSDDTSGKTIKHIKMPVKSRPKPQAFSKPEDADLFRGAIAEVNKSAVDARTAEKSAEAWVHGHEDYPERAEDNAAYYAGVAGENAGSAHDSMVETQHLAERVHSDADATARNAALAEQYKSQAAQSAADALQSKQNAKTSETAAQEAQAGAETAEGQAELFAAQAEEDKNTVEQAKAVVMEIGQKVADNKKTVEQTVDNFELLHKQAVADINNAGKAQTERVNEAGETAVDNIELSRQQAAQSVTNEGAAQVANVQAAAEEITRKVEQIDQNTQGITELKGDLVNLSKYSQNEITKVVSAVFQTEAHGFTTDFILINGVTYKMKCDFLGTIFVADDTGHSHNTVVNEVFEFTPSKTGNLAIWYPNSVIGSEVNVTVYGKYSETTDEKIKKLDDLTDVLFQNTTLAEFINGGYFDSAGNFIQNDGFVYTDYIDVNDGKTVRGRLRQFSKNLSMVVFYDTDKNIVSFYTGDGSTESKQISFNLAIPKTAKYVRFSSHRVDENDEYEYAYVSNVDNDTKIFVSEEIEKLEVSNELKNIPCPNQGYILPNGKISTEGFNWSGYIPIEKGSRIYGKGLGVGGNLCIYYFYDSELNPISGYKGTPVNGVYVLEEYDVFAPDGASYVAFTTHNANEKFKEVNANIEWTLKQYVTHEIDIFKKENELATKYYVGYGKTDNVKYFQKLTDCLWKVSKTDGKKEIYIHDGTYDVLAELGGMDYILSKNTTNNTYREVHPFVYDTKIIGVGHVVLNFLLDDGTPHENYWLFSCLGISGNCHIENIEIHSKNCRYSIHDESGNLYPDTERHYKNVRCYQNETSGVGGQAVGCGFSERTRVTLENCYFGARSESWSCHANDGCSFVFKDTVFDSYENLTHSLRISQNGTADLYATISNCFIDKGLSIRDEGQNPVVMDTTRVDLINTKVPNLVNGYTVITQPVTSYNTIDGTKSVMLATN